MDPQATLSAPHSRAFRRPQAEQERKAKLKVIFSVEVGPWARPSQIRPREPNVAPAAGTNGRDVLVSRVVMWWSNPRVWKKSTYL